MYFTCDIFSCIIFVSPFALTETILEEIRGSGFSVTRLKETVLSREMAEEFYKEHQDKPFFNQLVEFMSRLVYTRKQPEEEGQVTTLTCPNSCCHSKFQQHFQL